MPNLDHYTADALHIETAVEAAFRAVQNKQAGGDPSALEALRGTGSPVKSRTHTTGE